MKIVQHSITNSSELDGLAIENNPDLFLLFASPTYPDIQALITGLHNRYPDAILFGCSTAGEILGDTVSDASVSLTAISFESTKIKLESINLDQHSGDSYEVGKHLSQALDGPKLKHVFVLSDGLNVNGAELVKGLNEKVQTGITITGGLAGDGSDFNETYVIENGSVKAKTVIGLGFYGDDLKIGYGSKGGWDSFGLERTVTKSTNNVLYELDGQPALELYKSFLGDKAKDLPASGLLFPLSMRNEVDKKPVVRTILAVNEDDQSLTFAGNIPEGSNVKLMKANIDRLVDGAEDSAEISKSILDGDASLAILISCVGRRLVLKQLVEEEVEAVNEVLGSNVATTGFYSYGEIAPFDAFTSCTLHNQTMTITTLSE